MIRNRRQVALVSWCSQLLLRLSFVRPGCPFAGGGERDPVTPQVVWDLVGDFLEQVAIIDLPVLTGEDSHSAVLSKKSTSGGLDGWGWNELKKPFRYLGMLALHGSSGLLGTLVIGLMALLDAYMEWNGISWRSLSHDQELRLKKKLPNHFAVRTSECSY